MRKILTIASATLVLTCVQFSPAGAEVLITKAEAELPPATTGAGATRGLTRGPAIEQLAPNPTQRVASPFVFKVKFVTRNSVAIDPASVKLTYVKSQPIDLTDRIKAHVTPTGISMTNAEVPPGTHILRLDIADQQGRSGTAMLKLNVAGR